MRSTFYRLVHDLTEGNPTLLNQLTATLDVLDDRALLPKPVQNGTDPQTGDATFKVYLVSYAKSVQESVYVSRNRASYPELLESSHSGFHSNPHLHNSESTCAHTAKVVGPPAKADASRRPEVDVAPTSTHPTLTPHTWAPPHFLRPLALKHLP